MLTPMQKQGLQAAMVVDAEHLRKCGPRAWCTKKTCRQLDID
jgi:hypothetical protein